MIHNPRKALGPEERSENALIRLIHDELDKLHSIDTAQCSVQSVIQVKSCIGTVQSLCKYGKEQLFYMSVSGINHIRLAELEIQRVNDEVRKNIQKSKSKKNAELLHAWTLQE